MIKAHILIELSSGAKYKYVRNKVNDSNGVSEEYYQYKGAGYQEVGLTPIFSGSSNTGLVPGETYYFKVNVDAGGVVEYNITPVEDVEGKVNFSELIKKMNFVTANATWQLYDGDLRCTSDSDAAATSIALSAGAAGTDLFSSLNGWSGFDVASAGDQYADQTAVGKVKKDYTDLITNFTGAANFNTLLIFPEDGGATTILKRKNLENGLDDRTYIYSQIACGQIVAISVIENIVPL